MKKRVCIDCGKSYYSHGAHLEECRGPHPTREPFRLTAVLPAVLWFMRRPR